MVNHDPNNEEYKLDDLDLLAIEPEDQPKSEEMAAEEFLPEQDASMSTQKPWENPTLQRAAIVLGVLVAFFLCYKMIHSFWSEKIDTNQIKPVVVNQSAFKQVPLQSSQTESSGTSKKLAALQQQQNEMNATLQTLNNQVNTMNTEVSDVSSKITALSATVLSLSEKLDAQTKEMERLIALQAKRQVVRHPPAVRHGVAHPSDVYSIQALIPGRAWLISSSGSSMTVREGSTVPGYGVVKLIDVERGRVLTSSGRVIKFDQVDS